MIADIVVDTNIMLHANNPIEIRHDHARRFVHALMESTVCLCVDEGFNSDPIINRSLIGAEYIDKLRFGSLGLALIIHCAKYRRILELSRTTHVSLAKIVRQLIRKPRDRTFLIITINSRNKLFVSHDYEDFNINKRKAIRRLLRVDIVDAEEINKILIARKNNTAV